MTAAALSASAAPLVTIGDQLDVFFKGSVFGRWDSNITYASADKINDYSAVFRVGMEADYGRNSKFKANVKFYEDLIRYAEEKRFNANLSNVAFKASYEESALRVDANFSFNQRYQNSSTTYEAARAGQLVRYDDYAAGFLVSYDFTDKIGAEIGGQWRYMEYQGKWSDIYSDLNIYSVPVSVLYRITEKISAGLSYQYRYNTFSGGQYLPGYGDKRNDHFGGVTVRGELLPKLTVTAYAGVGYRDPNGNMSSDTTFSFNATIGYALTEKIGLFATGYRDFGNGASRQSIILSSGEFGVNYSVYTNVTLTGSFAFMNSKYQDSIRDDDEYIVRAGISYTPNKFFIIGANYRYINNASNIATSCYMQHLVDISVSLKY